MDSRIEKIVVSNSPKETHALGQQISSFLLPGSVVALFGNLGSGKTHLTKGIALGLGITETITSPTYTIINEYPLPAGIFSFYHIDAYRLNNNSDFEDIGGLEIIHSKGISIIEWSERIINFLPDSVIKISFEILDASSRLIKITGLDKI